MQIEARGVQVGFSSFADPYSMIAVYSQLMWAPICPIMVSRAALHLVLNFACCIEQVTIYFLKDLMSGVK